MGVLLLHLVSCNVSTHIILIRRSREVCVGTVAFSTGISSIRSARTTPCSVFTHGHANWFMTVHCSFLRALSSSLLSQGLLFLPNGAEPGFKNLCLRSHVAYTIGCVSYSPTEIPTPHVRVLSTPNGSRALNPAATSLEGKSGVILGATMFCTNAADFGLVPICLDAAFLTGGTITSGVAGPESLRVCMMALSSSGICLGGGNPQSMLTTPALSEVSTLQTHLQFEPVPKHLLRPMASKKVQ